MLKFTKQTMKVIDGVPVIGIKFSEPPTFDSCEWCFCNSRIVALPHVDQPKGICGRTDCLGIDMYIPESMFAKTIAKLKKLEQNENN